MEIEFDPEKSAANDRRRGLPFYLADMLEWDMALIKPDQRHDYGEDRRIATGPIDGRLYVVCFVYRGGKRRIISFRKANKREERAYEKARDEISNNGTDAGADEVPDKAADR
jgi:uncharacterized DUF497 family protein